MSNKKWKMNWEKKLFWTKKEVCLLNLHQQIIVISSQNNVQKYCTKGHEEVFNNQKVISLEKNPLLTLLFFFTANSLIVALPFPRATSHRSIFVHFLSGGNLVIVSIFHIGAFTQHIICWQSTATYFWLNQKMTIQKIDTITRVPLDKDPFLFIFCPVVCNLVIFSMFCIFIFWKINISIKNMWQYLANRRYVD